MQKPFIAVILALSFLFTFPVASTAQEKKPRKPRSSSSKGKPFRQYIRGERGGCHYVSNGKKVYVDRKYCN